MTHGCGGRTAGPPQFPAMPAKLKRKAQDIRGLATAYAKKVIEMVLYLACTPDKYELPVFVCDTADEMAAFMGMSKQSIWQMVSRKRKYERDGKPENGGRLHLFRVDLDEKPPICAECGAVFKRRQHNQTYCSAKCRNVMGYRMVKYRKEEKRDIQG